MKFKINDIVIGNNGANKYRYTKARTIGCVIATGDKYFTANFEDIDRHCEFSYLSYDDFDLHTPINKKTIQYLQQNGVRCPHCGSNDIEQISNTIKQEEYCIKATIECNDCDRKWIDIYTLTDVELI